MKIFLSLLFMVTVNFASIDAFLENNKDILKSIKSIVGKNGPTCFISRAYTGETDETLQFHETINEGLQRAGIKTYFDMNNGRRGLNVGDNIDAYFDKIKTVNFVLCLFTKEYKVRSRVESSGVSKEVTLIADRLKESNEKSGNEHYFLLPFLLDTDVDTSVPDIFKKRLIAQHQKRDLKDIFKDLFIHFYVFYFKDHRNFPAEKAAAIKSEIEQFFNTSLSIHSSLDTDSQTQVEDEECQVISHESPLLLASLPLFEYSLENVQPEISQPLLGSQESQHSECLVHISSFLSPHYKERLKRPRSPCVLSSQSSSYF